MQKLSMDQVAARATQLSETELRSHVGGFGSCLCNCEQGCQYRFIQFCLPETPEEICFARLEACLANCEALCIL